MIHRIKQDTMTARTSLPVLTTLLMLLFFASCIRINPPDNAVTSFGDKDLSAYTLGGGSISQQIGEIDVEWLDGDITIEYYDGSEVLLSETADKPLDSLTTLCYRVAHNELSVCYSKCRKHEKGQTDSLNKRLLIRLPQGTRLDDVSVDGVNVTLNMRGIDCKDIDVDGVDMTLNLADMSCGSISADGVNAALDLREVRCKELDVDGVEAHILAVFSQLPDEISADGLSATVSLSVPEDAGFTIEMDGLAKELTSDFPVSHKDGKDIIGDGRCSVNMDGMNSQLVIKTKE